MTRFVAQKPEDLPTQDDLFGMSGLEFLQAIVGGRLAAPPISGALNFAIAEAEEGRVCFRGTPEFSSLNPLGTVHGGWYGTLLDSCMSCAIQTMLPKGMIYTTLEYKINLVRSIPVGTEVVAEGKLQHAGRSTGIANGEIRGVADDKLYATGSTTCIIMKAPVTA